MYMLSTFDSTDFVICSWKINSLVSAGASKMS